MSDSEKKAAKKPTATAAPLKKKMTLKQKLAEKEKLAAEKRSAGADELIDERTEQDRRREARERELEADLAVASDLMGDMEVGTGELRLRCAAKRCGLSVSVSGGAGNGAWRYGGREEEAGKGRDAEDELGERGGQARRE